MTQKIVAFATFYFSKSQKIYFRKKGREGAEWIQQAQDMVYWPAFCERGNEIMVALSLVNFLSG
jgi:hypothetical protein